MEKNSGNPAFRECFFVFDAFSAAIPYSPFGAGIWARHSIHSALSSGKLSQYPLTAEQLNCRS
jgi:hypothetical protein